MRLPDEYPSLLQELEPRFMFDGAAVEAVDLADGVSEQEQAYILNAIEQNEQAHATESLLQAIEANAESFQTDYSQFKEVVIVDARVKDPHILIDSISRTAAIEVILPNQDGVDKIAELLAKYNNLDAVHIISHGDQAKLELGSVDLTANNLNTYQGQLAQWGQALTEQGDILFYGCNVAEGDQGQAFIDQLRALTSADIAASVDITGGVAFAGDSILESDQDVETNEIVDFSDYQHQLAWMLSDSNIAASASAEAVLTPDGQTLAVGAQGGTQITEARIYEWDGSTWQQKGSTLSVSGQTGFGTQISISDDGLRVVVGNNTGAGMNIVRAYQWYGSDWAPMGSDFTGTVFGGGTLNADGSRLAIAELNANRVITYQWNGTSWDQLGSQIIHSGESFAREVTFNDAGNIMVAGAENADHNGSDSGRLRIYEYNGTDWVLKGSPIDGTQAGERLGAGRNISLSADGLTVVASSPVSSINGTSSGLVRVYEWDGSDWAQKGQNFLGSSSYSSLGENSALSADGMRLILGDPRANSVGGIIYIYDWDSGSNSWIVSDTIEGDPGVFQQLGGYTFTTDQTAERISVVSLNKVYTYDAPPAPINTLPVSITVDEDSDAFAFTAGDAISVSDPDPTSVLQSVQLTVSFGVLNVSLSGGATISAGNNNSNTLTIDGNEVDINATLASLTYTPNLNQNTNDALSVVSSNSLGGQDSDAVVININSLNDAPVINIPAAQTVDEDVALVFNAANGNLITLSDPDALTPLVTLSVTSGSLTLAQTTGLTNLTGNGTSIISFNGAIADANTALDGLIYQSALDYNGTDTLTITIDDQGESGSGGALNDSEVVNITIDPVNDAPLITDFPTTLKATEGVSLLLNDGHGLIQLIDVDSLGSDTMQLSLSVANGVLSFANTTGLTFDTSSNNSSSMTISGTKNDINIALSRLRYQSVTGFSGNDTLNITVNDLGNSGSGGALQAVYNTTIEVAAVADVSIVELVYDDGGSDDKNFVTLMTKNTATIAAGTQLVVNITSASPSGTIVAEFNGASWVGQNGASINATQSQVGTNFSTIVVENSGDWLEHTDATGVAIALVNGNELIELISYEGNVAYTLGSNTYLSTDIGVVSNNTSGSIRQQINGDWQMNNDFSGYYPERGAIPAGFDNSIQVALADPATANAFISMVDYDSVVDFISIAYKPYVSDSVAHSQDLELRINITDASAGTVVLTYQNGLWDSPIGAFFTIHSTPDILGSIFKLCR